MKAPIVDQDGTCPSTPITKLKPWEGIGGHLHKVVQEGSKFLIAYIGEEAILLPNAPILTKGGHVDLRAWVGQDIDLQREDERYAVGLLPLDEKRMRIFELEEALADMIGNFAEYKEGANESGGAYFAAGLSALERAFKILGLAEGCRGEGLAKFWRASKAKEGRERAIKAVQA